MHAHQDEQTRNDLWRALGNQPGVSVWFAVWLLSRREARRSKQACRPAAPARRYAES